MNGCNHITAQNYDPNVTMWDHSCQYLLQVQVPNPLTGVLEPFCLLFEDVQGYEDKSFTMSWSVRGESWVFFHDYIPDFYFHTREQLFNSKEGNRLYQHHQGPPGIFYDETPRPFFIDIIFRTDSDILLEAVQWASSVLEDRSDLSSRDSEWQTLTHISVWNSQQHTGRIALQDVFKDLQYQTSRLTKGNWSFNDFRNIIGQRGIQFLQDLFQDYALDPTAVTSRPWYDTELMQDKYMCVRFEFDNTVSKLVTLHDTSIVAQKTNR